MVGQRLALIRKQLSQSSDRVAHNPTEHVVEVFPRADAVRFARLYQPKVHRGCMGASVARCEEHVFPFQGKGRDGILGRVVVRPEATVFQITIKGLPLIQCIVNGLSKRLRRKG